MGKGVHVQLSPPPCVVLGALQGAGGMVCVCLAILGLSLWGSEGNLTSIKASSLWRSPSIPWFGMAVQQSAKKSLCSSFLHKLWPLCALCHCRATGLYSLWPSSLEHLFFQAQPRAIGCSAGGCSFCTSASTAEQWASRAQDVQSISPACDPTVSHGLCQGHKKRFPALLCCNTIWDNSPSWNVCF